MRNGEKIDLGMTGYAELFMTDEERKTQTLPRIVDIPIELIDDSTLCAATRLTNSE